MHRLAATPGGWDSRTEGVVFIDQTPAPIVLLTAADTDISALAQALPQLPDDFSEVRAVNLLQLQQQLTIDTYAEDVLKYARLIVVRLLGGRAYWPYGLEVVKETAAQTGAVLVVMPGDDQPDMDLMAHSSVSLSIVNQLWRYFTQGGVDNLRNGLLFASNTALATNYELLPPKAVPKVGIYSPPLAAILDESNAASIQLSNVASALASMANTVSVDNRENTAVAIRKNIAKSPKERLLNSKTHNLKTSKKNKKNVSPVAVGDGTVASGALSEET